MTTDDDRIIERLARLEEQVKSIPTLLESQIAALVGRLEDVAQVITLHNETMAKNLRDTNDKVNKLDTRVSVLEAGSDDNKYLRRVVFRSIAGFVVFLVVAVGIAAAYIQALP